MDRLQRKRSKRADKRSILPVNIFQRGLTIVDSTNNRNTSIGFDFEIHTFKVSLFERVSIAGTALLLHCSPFAVPPFAVHRGS